MVYIADAIIISDDEDEDTAIKETSGNIRQVAHNALRSTSITTAAKLKPPTFGITNCQAAPSTPVVRGVGHSAVPAHLRPWNQHLENIVDAGQPGGKGRRSSCDDYRPRSKVRTQALRSLSVPCHRQASNNSPVQPESSRNSHSVLIT